MVCTCLEPNRCFMLKIYSSIYEYNTADDQLLIMDIKTVLRMCTICLSGSLSGSVRMYALSTEALIGRQIWWQVRVVSYLFFFGLCVLIMDYTCQYSLRSISSLTVHGIMPWIQEYCPNQCRNFIVVEGWSVCGAYKCWIWCASVRCVRHT